MGLLNNLNFLANIGTFACVSFALSGMGVKLGKLSSLPHKMGYKYISESTKSADLYAATAKLNNKFNDGAPRWTKDATELKKWCENHQTSTRYWKEAVKYCLINKNVWHQLIENHLTLKEPETTTESEVASAPENKCTYEALNRYSDGEGDENYLIGKKLCTNLPTISAPENPTQTSQSPQS